MGTTESGNTTAHQFTGAARQFIVQGASSAVAAAEVAAAHGATLSDLPVVHGVVAKLTAGEASVVSGDGLRVSPNLQVMVEGAGLPAGSHPSGVFTSVTGARSMWANGINGSGVTVAVLDTGIDTNLPDLASRVVAGVDLANPRNPYGWATDNYGHGTFVAGLIASNGQSSGGAYPGVAPGADLVSIKVAGSNGLTNESTVIEGVSWAIANEASDGIQVLNLSLGVEPTSPSALDPLDQAVEAAWNSGIVVVTSAGNAGPVNGSITSPGDDPLVITAGSMDDGAADVAANFTVPSFSSVGPTSIDGWFKPDLVAPGRSVVSVMPPNSTIYYENPQARIGHDNFVGSGTSFSAAVVSGLVALLLQANPGLTPDQVKAALLYGASPGPVGSPLVDGHGIANVMTANADAGHVFLDQGPAAAAESSSPGTTVSLSSTWAASTWNPANWSGPAWNASPLGASVATRTAPTATASGLSWLGAAWNGAAWNGAAWNAQTWQGAAWNGAAWNGAAWNGAAWNGAAWNGAAWNGAAWNGAAWNDETWG
ncbi:MAG: S8 family peptidase [Acidimicrobiales bacterium]